MLRELVEMMVTCLVDEPDQVAVSATEGEQSLIIQVRVVPDDLGKVIGKNGRIANALRTIARAAGAKTHKAIWIEINKHGEPFDDEPLSSPVE